MSEGRFEPWRWVGGRLEVLGCDNLECYMCEVSGHFDPQHQMYEIKCEDESHVWKHLELLSKMQEQLAGMEARVTNMDMTTIILS